MQLLSGTLLERGKYRIIETLGRGGFGITYLAEHAITQRKVCIKEFFPKDYYKRDVDSCAISLSSDGFAESMNRYKEKFVKEAQTIATFNHPNIIPIYDAFEENGTAYYVMEYIEGESLSDIVKRIGALDEAAAVGYIRQVAEALDYIHRQKVMHLDVKPGNIMVHSEDHRAILIDFGLSKHYDAKSGDATSTTPVGVSHGYAPMEQYQQGGVSSFSPTTDIYALGATLYYLVTGSVPLSATDVGEDGLPTLPAHLSSSLCKAIEKSMSYWRKDRPQTIKEFLALLDGCAAPRMVVAESTVVSSVAADDEKTRIVTPQPKPQPKVEQPKPKGGSNPKKSKRGLWIVLSAFIVAAVVLFVLFGGGSSENSRIAEEQRQAEEQEQARLVEEQRQAEEERINDMVAQGLGRDGVYQVGDYYNVNGKEGVVFEVSADGRYGKIVSLDQEEDLEWCTQEKYSEEYYKDVALELTNESDGKVNTDNVMQRSDSDKYPAFAWCREKGDDWYLPAIDELESIYNNRSKINSTLAKYGGSKLSEEDKYDWYLPASDENSCPEAADNDLYWSSTEYKQHCAYIVFMDVGGTSGATKNCDCFVRAVSAF